MRRSVFTEELPQHVPQEERESGHHEHERLRHPVRLSLDGVFLLRGAWSPENLPVWENLFLHVFIWCH